MIGKTLFIGCRSKVTNVTKRGELPVLPREVAAERRKIQLFLAYLRQPAPQAAILGVARRRGKLEETTNYLNRLWHYTGRPDADLRELLKAAPALQQIAKLVYEVPAEMFPGGAVPSDLCIQAALASYHRWVRSRAGRL